MIPPPPRSTLFPYPTLSRSAARRQLAFAPPEGRQYRLREDGDLPTIVPRPRGGHLPERHLLVDGEPSVGALVDAGLYLFHNAREQLDRGSGPYFYLPKMEGHLEAGLWKLVFDHARSEEHTSELQSRHYLVCRLLLE